MKFWSVIVLMVFLNFTVLPSIAVIFDYDLQETSTVMNEEETLSGSSSIIYEKTIPKILDVYDYLKFTTLSLEVGTFILKDDDFHLSPLLTIFSPPPEA